MQCTSSTLAAVAALVLLLAVGARTYDPDDAALATVLPPPGSFEPFYARAAFGSSANAGASAGAGAGGDEGGGDEEDDGSESVRAPHGHATFYKHRHPALVDAKNAAAYGFRFDGGRRFNYD